MIRPPYIIYRWPPKDRATPALHYGAAHVPRAAAKTAQATYRFLRMVGLSPAAARLAVVDLLLAPGEFCHPPTYREESWV